VDPAGETEKRRGGGEIDAKRVMPCVGREWESLLSLGTLKTERKRRW